MRVQKITPLLLFLFLSLSLIVNGQINTKMLSPKHMKKDLKVLLKTLDGHPDPYTKISEKDFKSIVNDVENNITEELDEIDFYKNLSRIVASIGDGHSRIFMPKSWVTKLRKQHGVFPYEMFLSNDNELFVIKSYGDQKLPLGVQILEINGMAVDSFINTVTPHISYETIPFRNVSISESFELMLYLAFKQVDKLNFKFKIDKETEVTIPSISYSEWRGQKKDLREIREKKVSRGEPYNFKIIKPGIAKIDIFSFAVSDIENYNLFLHKTFKKIKKNEVHSLIIDIRGNYGGWPKVASELFHYIHEGYFKTMAKSSMKISYPYRSYYTDRFPMLTSSNFSLPQRRHFLNIEEIVKGELDTYVDEDAFFNEKPITETHEFNGDCYVLIDRKSYSASSSFASTFQCYGMGIIIGEPTGGTKIFRANAFRKIFPKTRFGVSLSTTKLFTACFDKENEPILPNLEVIPSILDRVHNIDPQLNTALILIKKMQYEKNKN